MFYLILNETQIFSVFKNQNIFISDKNMLTCGNSLGYIQLDVNFTQTHKMLFYFRLSLSSYSQ